VSVSTAACRSPCIKYSCDSLPDCCLQGVLIPQLICLAGSLPASERVHSCLQVTVHQIQLRELATQFTEFFQVSLNTILIHFQPYTEYRMYESGPVTVNLNFQSLFSLTQDLKYYLSMKKNRVELLTYCHCFMSM
jgi:hypothetical protein